MAIAATAGSRRCDGLLRFLHHRADFNGRLLFGSFLAWIQLRGHTYRRRTLRMVPAHLVLFRSCGFGHNPPVVSDFYVQKLQAPETAHHRLHAPVHGMILHSVALGIQCHRRIGRLLELFRPVRACYCRSCPLARMALHMPRPETARVNRQAQVIRKSTIIAARTVFYQN